MYSNTGDLVPRRTSSALSDLDPSYKLRNKITLLSLVWSGPCPFLRGELGRLSTRHAGLARPLQLAGHEGLQDLQPHGIVQAGAAARRLAAGLEAAERLRVGAAGAGRAPEGPRGPRRPADVHVVVGQVLDVVGQHGVAARVVGAAELGDEGLQVVLLRKN